MKTVIRKAFAEDYSDLIKLFDEIDTIHRTSLPHLFQKPTGPVRAMEYYLGLISAEDVAVFVAEVDGEVVGFVHAMVKVTPDLPMLVPRRFTIVDGIVVSSINQKRGIGRKLMTATEKWATAQGASSIELNVYEFNVEAMTFYESLGFKTMSRKLSKELGGKTGVG